MASTMMRSHRHEARVRPGPLGPHGLKGWRGVLWLRSAGRVLRRTGGSRIAAVVGEGGRSKAGRAAGGVRAISELSYVRGPVGGASALHPVDLAWYVARVAERSRFLSPSLVAIARDHAAFVQGLTRQRP